MPATPVTWLNEFTVNLTTTGSQFSPTITHLANGNILVTWVSTDDTGVGSPAGSDLIGQIFDPMGVRVGGEFLVNSGTSTEGETDPDVAALPSGGFLTVFERPTASGFSDIILTEHSANGTVVQTVSPFFDGNTNAAPAGFDPAVAVFSNTSALVVWRESESATDSKIVGRFYDSSTNTLSAAVDLINFAGFNSDPSVTALNNGNYVIAATSNTTGDNDIIIRIVNGAGGNVLGVTNISVATGAGESDTDASVTALAGGGFVVSWTNTDATDTDVQFQVFNSAGGAVGGLGTVTLNGVDNGNESVVVALNDGGFLVIHDEDTEGNLTLRRYNSTGGSVGSEFVIAVGAGITTPDAELLADGRVAITFTRDNGEIGMEIIDVRDFVNDPAVYTTSQQIGTIFNDSFTVAGSIAHGGDGNDTITSNFGTQTLFGDNGDDTFVMIEGRFVDNVDGGSGSDTLDLTNVTSLGAVVNLSTGVWDLTPTFGGPVTITAVENVEGTQANDTITGNGSNNVLSGNGGEDTIIGGSGQDTLNGGDGNDDLSGGFATDTVNGGAGNDVIRVLDGEFGDDVNGGAGNDDTYNFENLTNFRVVINLAAGTSQIRNPDNSLFGPANTVSFVENVRGGSRNDHITGDANQNDLAGVGGNDTLVGGLGNDNISGGDGDDYISGQDGNDFLEGNIGDDNMYGGIGADTMNGGADDDNMAAHSGNDTMNGQTGNDTMFGGGNQDIMNGGDGDDTIFGQAGDDNIGAGLVGGAGNDTVNGGGGNDLINGNDGNDTLLGSQGNDTINGGNGDDNLNGGSGNDTLNGQGDNDTMFGGIGIDTLNGGDGDDNMQGGNDDDTLNGGNGADILNGATGNDTMTGGAGTDRFNFINNWGDDVITDFANNGLEKINLGAVAGINNIGNLTISNFGGGALITFGPDSIHVLGVTAAQLDNSDFIF